MKRCLNLILIIMSAALLTSCGSVSVGPFASSASSGDSPPEKTYFYKSDLRATCDLTKIAYVGDGHDMVVNDGSSAKVVYTTDAFYLDGVQWSPDGRYVSFYRVGTNYLHELLICDTKTGRVMESGESVYGDQGNTLQRYIWSADSTKAIFYSNTGGGYYDVPADRAVEIAPVGKGFYTASFSPDGNRLFYCEGDRDKGTYSLKIYDFMTGNRQEVYQYGLFNPLTTTPPLWLSDGEILLFEMLGNKACRIEAATGKAMDFPIDCTMSDTLRLSPNRQYIAYETKSGVIVRNVDTGMSTVIKTKDGSVGYPVWGYDSQVLLMCCKNAIWIYDVHGVQIKDVVKADRYGAGDGRYVSDPVFTKTGLWYEGEQD